MPDRLSSADPELLFVLSESRELGRVIAAAAGADAPIAERA